MPWTIFRGCWFHFTRAVTRRWRRLRLNRAPQIILHLTWVLPLVPANLFRQGFEEIRRQANLAREDFPRVNFFISYLETFWLPLADRVSTRHSVIRTNNVAEAFNRQLIPRLGGGNLDLFLFIERLAVIIRDEELRWRRLDQGHDLGAERRAYQSHVDSRIINFQRALDNERITVVEFLHSIMLQRVEVAIMDANIRLNDENFDSEDEMPRLQDLEDPINAAIIPENPLPPARNPRRRFRRQGVGANGQNMNQVQGGAAGHDVPQNVRQPRGRPRNQNAVPDPIIPIVIDIHQEEIEELPAEVLDDAGGIEPVDGPRGIYEQIEIINFDGDEVAEEDDMTCVICLINRPKMAVVPCNHICLCLRCNFGRELQDAENLMRNQFYRPVCPLCRGPFRSARQT
ncbi:uncharacterized protein LOC130670128 [Microplitis mediator]|uniref:uncharacterized protein LOC130670128 n=1 Tax=Microplitis mediator TaxID=375433 RepID=UPI002556E6AD|nr:uncharacterized protein LOC130670128 [Microplitis mediator]